MSRAFVREPEGGEAFEDLPDRTLSPHHLVTPAGLAQMDAELKSLQVRLDAAKATDDKAEVARLSRDLRYWSARRVSAEVVPPPTDTAHIRFGARVTFEREDGRRQTYRIVGEDEADPTKGTISYVSPLAQAMMGKEVGDSIPVGTTSAEIIEIAI
ncbi:transcription elongation factor GreA [Microvirga guangxiensis]|uniref:Transcription elongation factor, GreA/GreB family n=1 Tax=Microvirga guangxiensis TaxID=549386 RepID=A0A1G5IAN9_9HYPH|nr:transcription elongation factor GreA [Microvirga guangxiensis]SCY73064.1 Transcription elongation factor, GreA/GreB family [Microvirga guangxiensis]